MEPDELAQRIRAERKKHHLSMDKLAEKIGTNRIQVIRWELRNQGPSETYAEKLAALFGIPADELVRRPAAAAAEAATLRARLEELEATVAAQDQTIEANRKAIRLLRARVQRLEREPRLAGGGPAQEASRG